MWGLHPPFTWEPDTLAEPNPSQCEVLGPLQLLGDRGVFCPAQRSLFVADLHLGKDATFQSYGIAVPLGGTQATLERLARMIRAKQPRQVIILGDLFHARSSLTEQVRTWFADWLEGFSAVDFLLVRGNHDAHLGPLPMSWRLEVVDPPWPNHDRVLVHVPRPAAADERLVLAGHLHPAVRLSDELEISGKFPCFHFAAGCLTLPAIGEFTGTALVRRQVDDRVWAVIEDQVVPIPEAKTRRHRRGYG